MAWYDDLYKAGKDYLKERYLGGDASSAANILKDATGAYTAYKSYEDQKRANEALESAYRDYVKDKETSQATIEAALALGLSPMTVSGMPTTKAEITDFTEVQDVAKGGIISLPNKKRKKYARGPEIEDIEEMDEEIITPFDLKNEEGVPIGPMVERIKELKIKVQDGTITKEEIIELRNLESKAMFQMAKGPDDDDDNVPLEQEPVPNWFDLMREEGIAYQEQVKKDPQLVKPPWMIQEEWLNFQYGRNEAAKGGIMNLKKGGRPGFENGSYPTNHKFWELVDWEHENKKSQNKEDAINADMEAGMSWDEIKKKYNLKDFEDISIKETEREETDSGNKVKEIFETIKEKVGSIDFSRLSPYKMAKGGRTGYAFGSNGADPEKPPIYLPDPNEDPENMKMALGEGFKSEELNRMAIDMFGKELRLLDRDELEQLRNEYEIKKGRIEASQGPVLPSPEDPINPFAPKPTGPVLPDRMIAAQGGRMGYAMGPGPVMDKTEGGIMDLGGMEKDYRFSGGFVPIGEYEKKDDVPARLSKNEFVMTADAVRAAGGGNINQGAQRMYNIMKNLEAQPTAKRRVA